MKKIILLAILCISCIANTYAQLDPLFGVKGIVKTDMGSSFNYTSIDKQVLLQADGSMYLVFEEAGLTLIAKKLPDGSADASYGNKGFSVPVAVYGVQAVLQPDGRIVIAGNTINANQYFNQKDFAVARFNIDGSLDNSFSGDGIQVTDFGFTDVADCLTLQSDGKIVVAGYSTEYNSYSIGHNYFALARYNTDGSPDNTFNGNGRVRTDFGSEGSNFSAVAIQSDGKIVAAGQTYNGSSSDFAVIRYNSNGSLDITFSEDGMQITDFSSSEDFVQTIAIQGDGKILAAGSAGKKFGIVRYNTDGGLDKTFDADGMQTNDFNFGGANCLTTQKDGKIVAAGSASNGSNVDFVVVRYNMNGSLDNTFDGDGKQTTDFASSDDDVNSIAVQSDGKLLALGFSSNGKDKYLAAARYASDGSPDVSFHKDRLLIDHVIQGDTHFTETAIQGDGKIVTSGYSWNGRNYDFALARYNVNGSLDNTFSDDGKQMTDFGSSNDKANAIAIQSDGKILVAGSAGGKFAVARYNTDGSLDNTFDVDGLQTIDIGSSDSATSIAIQSDGKILVGGTALVRFNTNGSLDLSFDGDGKITKPFVGNSFNCYDVAIQKDGKIVVVGNSSPYCVIARYNIDGSVDITFGNSNGTREIFATGGLGAFLRGSSIAIQNDGKIVVGGDFEFAYKGMVSQFFLARLNTDGSLDGTFDSDGVVFTFPGSNRLDYGTSLVIENDQKILLAGYSYNGTSDDFALIRYNTNGSLDNTFSGDGIEITSVSSAYDRIAGIAIADDALYAVGYGQYPGNLGVIAKYLFATGGPLPVTLTDFTGTLKNKSVLLQWQTATEQNLSDFIIERGADGNTFLPIGRVAATGNSSSKINYSTLDQQPLEGVNFYRLKLVDLDQNFKYSKTVAVDFRNQGFAVKISPNPAKDILFIRASGENEKATLQIIDESGRILKNVKVTLNASTSFPIYINTLPKGIYNLRLHTKAKVETIQFIKE